MKGITSRSMNIIQCYVTTLELVDGRRENERVRKDLEAVLPTCRRQG